MARYIDNESARRELDTSKFGMTGVAIGRRAGAWGAQNILVAISDLRDSYTR
jgi:hypothetical protein